MGTNLDPSINALLYSAQSQRLYRLFKLDWFDAMTRKILGSEHSPVPWENN
jgi:hypothetical protein